MKRRRRNIKYKNRTEQNRNCNCNCNCNWNSQEKARGDGEEMASASYISMDALAEAWRPKKKVFVSERMRKRPLQGLSLFKELEPEAKKGLGGHSFSASFGSTPTGRIGKRRNKTGAPSSRSPERNLLQRSLSQQTMARERAMRMSSTLRSLGAKAASTSWSMLSLLV